MKTIDILTLDTVNGGQRLPNPCLRLSPMKLMQVKPMSISEASMLGFCAPIGGGFGGFGLPRR